MPQGQTQPKHYIVSEPQAISDWEDKLYERIALMVTGVVKEAVAVAIKEHALTPEERDFLRLAVKREAQRERWQSAVIEKSLAGLVWAALAAIATLAYKAWIATIPFAGGK